VEVNRVKKLTRRQFIKLTGMAAAGVTLFAADCTAQPATPTVALRHPDIIKFYPDVPSKVVQIHHAGVWDGEVLVPEALRQMLDASITELTGLSDAAEAWAALFSPDEHVAIKVNTIEGSEVFTHVSLVMAVAESLQDAGIPPEQIVIFDRTRDELVDAGYTINKDGPGVRCYGTDGHYTAGWELMGSRIRLSDVLLQCDALINVPVLKAHGLAGLSFAMKNHYGTFANPEDYHQDEAIQSGIAELNALEPIKDRTRLIIGDVLAASTVPRSTNPYWTLDAIGDSIMMSFDPVAHDARGLVILGQMGEASHKRFPWADRLANPWLARAAELGLGTNDPANLELVELNLG
jgi:uncharacterized Fe-S center protein